PGGGRHSLRHGRRGHRPCQRQPLRSGRCGLDPRCRARPPGGGQGSGGHLLDQRLQDHQRRVPLRWLQAKRLWTLQWRRRPEGIHSGEKRLGGNRRRPGRALRLSVGLQGMTMIELGSEALQDLQDWRHDFHRHPETAFEEHRTAARVAALLREWGLEVHEGLAGTGVVGVLRGALGEGPAIGLRADMDALHVTELNEVDHASTHVGRMHACGHDGHTTMLLGAARHLAANPDFRGQVVFIFQPAEENEGGARVMMEEGLFERFPVQAVYALHNWPGLPVGVAAVHGGPVMAAFDIFKLTLRGKGCHAAMPHLGKDTLLAACQLVTLLPALIAREQEAHKPAVLSVTSFHAGDTFNVMPEEVKLLGTMRCYDMTQRARIEQRLRDTVAAFATLHGLDADLDYQVRYPATVNDPAHAD